MVLEVGGEACGVLGCQCGGLDLIDASEGFFGVPGEAFLSVGVTSVEEA